MLRDILTLLSREGVNTSNAASREHAIIGINLACSRLFNKRDIEGSIDEVVLQVARATHQVALPREVGVVRKVKPFGWGRGIDLYENVQNYNVSGERFVSQLNYRMRPYQPLCADIVNASTIRISLPLAVSAEVAVVIIGQDENSANIVERVAIPAGAILAESTRSFRKVRQLLRSGDDTYDIYVADANDLLLATIPNNAKESRYTVLQVVDAYASEVTSGDYYAIEVLYKKALPYLSKDDDSFICGDRYDEAIYWEYRIHEAAKPPGDREAMRIAAAMQSQILNDISNDLNRGHTKRIDVDRTPSGNIGSLIARGQGR